MSVLVGVCDIGDTATLGKMGKKLISRFLVVLLIVSLFSTIIVFPLAGLKISSELSGNHNFFDIFQMLLNILPKNVADAFLSGNTMQIIVIALACGVALLIMESKAQPVISIAEQINSMIYIIMEWISSLVPILIFVVILSNIWSGSVDTIIQIWKPLVTIITLFYIVMCIYFVYVSLRLKISVVSLIKKIMPSYIIALTTASSTAAFGETKNCCEKRIGIESTFVKFAIPLGIVAFKPGTVICYVVLSMFSAAIYGVEISVGWLVMLVIIAVILSVATPPVLGGALTAFTMLFLQLGIPVEALVMVMTIDVIVDFFSTGMNMAMVQADLAVQAKKLDILNKNILHKQP